MREIPVECAAPVEIDIRAVRRLRESPEAQAAIEPMVEALCRHEVDLTAVRAVCDWIQYRSNFREIAMVRPGSRATW